MTLQKLIKNLSLLKIILFSSILFLNITPHKFESVQAGLEFQWNNDEYFRKLKWYQKNNERRRRNTIFFFLRPSDRKTGLIKINIKLAKGFSSPSADDFSLCKVRIGGFESRTKCLETLPSDVEIDQENNSVNIFPYSPVPANRESYAVLFKTINPRRTGLYQFHSHGQASGSIPVSRYLGSYTIVID